MASSEVIFVLYGQPDNHIHSSVIPREITRRHRLAPNPILSSLCTLRLTLLILVELEMALSLLATLLTKT